MKSIVLKELKSFFASPIGYLVIAIYLIINGLFLWVFSGEFNMLHAGFADLNSYFVLAPSIFLFLIPAITMRCFADEFQSGTIELLQTLPISHWQLTLGKFFGCLLLVLFAMLPTLIYVYSIDQLGSPVGNLSYGTVFGSFFGLIFLASVYTAVGVLSSALSKNQIVAFLIAVSISFILYYGFDLVASSGIFNSEPSLIQNLGLLEHFKSISKGVLDTRDILYFISITAIFLKGTQIVLSKVRKLKSLFYVLAVLLLLNLLGNNAYSRFDLTEDKRYTLNPVSEKLVEEVTEVMTVTVYLDGNFPTEFKRLQIETRQHLEELRGQNRNILFKFIDPVNMVDELVEQGLEPSTLQLQEGGKISELVIFPYALIEYKNQHELVPLLLDTYSNSQNDQLEASIQNLEFAFTNAIFKLISPKSKSIAILRGNGELDDIYLTDFLLTLGSYYRLAPFTLDSVQTNPVKTMEELSSFDMAIIAKPTETFTEKEKYMLDQFIMRGGKTLWLIDPVQAELDSMMVSGETLAYARDLNITDLFFNYGVRINPNLVVDRYSTQIPLATGNVGNQTQFNTFPWNYYPLIPATGNHPITTNVQPVSHRFTSSIDTLKNDIKKTVLLRSSPQSKVVGTPVIVSLQSIRNSEDASSFNDGLKPTAVLLEGEFKSAYAERTLPIQFPNSVSKSNYNSMVIAADGDLMANGVTRGIPEKLGVNKWTNEHYGNKDFLMNSIHYLLGDTDLLNVRSKSVNIQFLDKEKAYVEANKWQAINLMLPLVLLALFGLSYTYFRKKKYQTS